MATPTRSGPEFLVNATVNADQYGPAITGLANGRFVITYTDTSGNAPEFSINTRAQIFNADGSKFGGEFIVNTTQPGSQYVPAIAALGSGFVITFNDLSGVQTAPDFADVRAQVFDASGAKVGGEFVAPATTAGIQSDAVVTALAHGRYVVVWTDSSGTGGDTSSDAIRAQVFNAGGSRFGAEFLVNSTVAGQQYDPAVTTLANGNFAVAWTSFGADGFGQPVRSVNAQLFRPDGTPIGSEYVGNAVAGNLAGQGEPAITGLAGGRYVVTWTNTHVFDTDIQGQVFNANGGLRGAVIAVNTTTVGAQGDSSTAALTGGGFVTAWVDHGLGGLNPEIRAQVFGANGARSGAEFLVNADTNGIQRAPSVAALSDGRFVVTWEDNRGTGGDADFSIRAQVFDSRSAAISLTGTSGSDTYVGTRLNDTLAGGAGNDGLSGMAGDDVLRGGTGRDVLTGGGGKDSFVFATAAEAGRGPAKDRITDFQHGADHLDLRAFVAGGQFIQGAVFVAGDGPQVRFDAARGLLEGDVTGNGSADFSLKLDGVTLLDAADFVF